MVLEVSETVLVGVLIVTSRVSLSLLLLRMRGTINMLPDILQGIIS